MLPRSGRVGTIHTSAAEVRDRSRTAICRGVLFNDIAPRSCIQDPGGEGVKAEYELKKKGWMTWSVIFRFSTGAAHGRV